MSDILELPRALDSAFGSDTFEITLEHFSSIPAGVVEGLNVSRFIVDGPETSAVSPKAFDGVNSLRWFHVYLSSLTHIPNFRNVTHSLRQVNIDNSQLVKVENEFQSLPLLTRLSLRNNTLESIQPDAFDGTTGIQFLDLTHNKLVSLPPSLFNELTALEKLDLSHNRLRSVRGLFDSLGKKLRFLNLGFNNLSDVDAVLPPKMLALTSLSLNNNPVRKLSVNTFRDSVLQLNFLSLSHCNLTEFRPEFFKNLSHLKLLDLSYNQIKHVESQYLIFGDGFDLIMNGNAMESFDGGIIHRTRSLFIADNNLQYLGNMITKTKLSVIDVSGNRLISLEKKDFTHVYQLQFISFRNNQIEKIDSRCFESAENSLTYLDLGGNRLTSLNSSLQFLPVLKTLIISNNLLGNLDYQELKGLNELSSLYLQNNRILALNGKVQNLPNLQYLSVENNVISQLGMNQIPGRLQYLHIKGNPWKCNCQLYYQFLKKLNKGFPELDIVPCTQNTTSEDPSLLPCPSPCSCYCDGSLTPPSISANCSSRYLTSVPSELKNVKLSSSTGEASYRIDDTDFVIHDKIVSLDLSYNNIGSLDEIVFFRNLEKLYLDHNRLTTLPYDIMDLPKLKEMSLSGNKWECDCDAGKAIAFRNWLLPDERHVVDINRTLCHNLGGNKVIVSVPEAEICPGQVGLYLIIGLVVLGLFVLILAFTILYTRYKSNIKWRLRSKGIIRPKQEDATCDKTLDAFISFSNADRDFVTEQVVPGIKERFPDMNIFIEGIFLYESLMKERKLQAPSSLGSNITVIIVTRNFLEDESCLSVMPIHKEEHDEFHPMIVVKASDVPPHWEEKIKVFVPNATYLEWGDQHFWNNFRNVVPQTLGRITEIERDFSPLVTSEL